MDRGLQPSIRMGSASTGKPGAFTLIELMVVVGIMAIVMTMSIPLVYKVTKREPMNKAVRDIVEVCSNARAMAIMRGRMTEVVFQAHEGTFQVVGGGPSPETREVFPGGDPAAPPPDPQSGLSAKLSDKVAIQDLRINGLSYMDQESARIRFYPNGTCDDARIVLLNPEKSERLTIWLEITTSLTQVGHSS
jgi:prepilin-type N-terminal cleavage/methylation domain-containing protein